MINKEILEKATPDIYSISYMDTDCYMSFSCNRGEKKDFI